MLSPVKVWVLAMLAPSVAARGSGSAAKRGEFDRVCARLPLQWQVGTKERVLCRTKEHGSVSKMTLAE